MFYLIGNFFFVVPCDSTCTVSSAILSPFRVRSVARGICSSACERTHRICVIHTIDLYLLVLWQCHFPKVPCVLMNIVHSTVLTIWRILLNHPPTTTSSITTTPTTTLTTHTPFSPPFPFRNDLGKIPSCRLPLSLVISATCHVCHVSSRSVR